MATNISMAAKNGLNKRLLSMSWIFLVLLLAKHSLVDCGVCDVSDALRIYCGYQGINEASCKSRGCCWKAAAVSGIPWCFYDSGIAAKFKTKTVCEHTGPAVLICNSTQQIKIHDVFYGRNADDNSCHGSGSITCFNPNATRIVRNICKTNSTCTVSPKGNIWNFDSITCDQLNAQLRINYICVAIATNSSIHQSPVPSTSIRVSPSVTKTKSLSPSSSQHMLTPVSSSSKHNYRTVDSSSMPIMSTKIVRSSVLHSVTTGTTVSKTTMPPQSSICSTNHKVTPGDGKFVTKIQEKDRIILGLSIVIAAMSIVIAFMILLKICKKQNPESEIKGSEDSGMQDSGMQYKDLKAKSDQAYANDDFVLESENPYYVSV